jgi:nucleotide-binding universal stress UspA family protein
MYKHILLPVDGSDPSAQAAKECIALAKSIGASITALHVTEPYRLPVGQTRLERAIGPEVIQQLEAQYADIAAKAAESLFAGIRESARASGVACETLSVTDTEPYRAIIYQAERLGCDLVMMGSHGRRGLEGLLLGSVTVKVLTHCGIPVLVVR